MLLAYNYIFVVLNLKCNIILLIFHCFHCYYVYLTHADQILASFMPFRIYVSTSKFTLQKVEQQRMETSSLNIGEGLLNILQNQELSWF